ncbi:hypothetical protein HanIR_Chr12g0567951 [Helianthus annuus]|nr:hypothetical protein HanIR_Chr12g0567951 [Helianthus annuus]
MTSEWANLKPNTDGSTGLSPFWAEPPPQPQVLTSQWAFVSNQNQSIQSILLSENETGSNNRRPKLMHMNEYAGWHDRFHTYILGQNTELWLRFITDFDQALDVAASTAASYADLSLDDKKIYDLEKKAFSILSPALNRDIYHQFVSFNTTKLLWDALKTRGEGNEASHKLRHDLLKKEFDGFMHMQGESLKEMTSRFFHLLTELSLHSVTTTPAEVVKKLADALPPQWNEFLEILKYNETLTTTTINDFVQMLENKDQEEILKAKRVPVPQNLDMYYGAPSTAAKPATHAPIQTAFVSSTDLYGNPILVPAKPAPTTDLYGNPLQRVPQQQSQ